ncbi:Bro-N domain-containing protein [Providencia rettgeri]|nr:Bro-N domain-containing protein [Providencia rettgeri]
MKSLKSGLSANGQTCSKFQSDNILNINSDDISIIRFEGIQVRIVKINNNPWFVAKDVCDALEIINSRDALKALDLDEKNTVALNYGIQGNPNRQVIAESGFYKLIARSRKATTKDTFA